MPRTEPTTAPRACVESRIACAIEDTSLGRLLVATTARGICLVAFGERDDELLDDARHRFPRARLAKAEGEHAEWIGAIVRLVEAPSDHGKAAAPPLDAGGTVFQQQVWSALREIPLGETTTYGQLASSIGRPTATRAVARACAANPTAVVVPCHRVIAANGVLAGYRWGVQRKEALRARERMAATA